MPEHLWMIVAIIFALAGSYLVAEAKARSRFYGFVGFVVANILWIIHGALVGDTWIIIMYSLFILLAIKGLWANRRKSQIPRRKSMNDINSWLAEYYPTPANKCVAGNAAGHSLQKFIGLLPKNLKKHNVSLNDVKSRWRRDSGIDWATSSCALCIIYSDHSRPERHSCSTCPLHLTFSGKDSPCCQARGVPWEVFLRNGNPKPMIAALRKAKEYEEQLQGEKA